MSTIYKRSYLTIAVTSGLDGDSGLFRHYLPCTDNHSGQISLRPCPARDGLHVFRQNRTFVAAQCRIRNEPRPSELAGLGFLGAGLSRRIPHFMLAQLCWDVQPASPVSPDCPGLGRLYLAAQQP